MRGDDGCFGLHRSAQHGGTADGRDEQHRIAGAQGAHFGDSRWACGLGGQDQQILPPGQQHGNAAPQIGRGSVDLAGLGSDDSVHGPPIMGARAHDNNRQTARPLAPCASPVKNAR